MKDKIKIVLLFALMQIVNVLNMSAEEFSGTCGTNLTWQLDMETGVLKIDGEGSMARFTSIKRVPWYNYMEAVKTVEIGNGVTSVNRFAFNCPAMVSVKIGASVSYIDFNAFRNCSSLQSIVIDKGNAEYDSRDNCNAIIETSTNTLLMGCQNTTIPNTVTNISNSVFSGCGNPKDMFIPASVTSIDDGAFNGCSDINSIIVEKGNVTYNSDYNCNAVIETATGTPVLVCNKTVITQQVKHLNAKAFREAKLTGVKVEEGHPLYDSRDNCNAIIETKSDKLVLGFDASVIPTSVTTIGKGAFSGCTFSSISLPASLVEIESNAFSGCGELTSIELPNTLANIRDSVFHYCNKLDNVVIPNSVTSIGECAFGGCKLTNITIPNSVQQIGVRAFYGCKFTDFTIPTSITEIPPYMFQNCTNLQNVTIPNTVTIIGDGAFYWCSKLKKVDMSESVEKIGRAAFSMCYELKDITIPNSVVRIGASAFSSCRELTSLFIPQSVKYIGIGLLSDCSNISKIVVDSQNPWYDSRGGCNAIIDTESGCLLAGCKNTVIPTGVTSIGWSAFRSIYGLKTISIPETVTDIDAGVFANCSNLVSVYCYATVPPNMSTDGIFPQSITAIYVPESSVSSYKTADYWRSYNILPMDSSTGVYNIDSGRIEKEEKGIMYDIMGRRINRLGKNVLYIQNGVKKVAY